MQSAMPKQTKNRRRSGFTLTELLIVIGIIAVLVGILIPVVSSVRRSGQAADTTAMIRALDNAARAYYSDHQSYPGILPEEMLGPYAPASGINVDASDNGYSTLTGSQFAGENQELENITGTENLVLSLQGGLVRTEDGIVYDPAAVGRGPVVLRSGQGKGYSPYIEVSDSDLSWRDDGGRTGRYADDLGTAGDSLIPEFVDRFSNPMPVLYLRANLKTGRNALAAGFHPRSSDDERAVYYVDQVIGYTGNQGDGRYIGIGREAVNTFHQNNNAFHGLQVGDDTDDTNGYRLMEPSGDYPGPYDAVPYLTDPTTGSGARQAESYVIISAGPDRVYGTRDDVTSFGSIGG